MYVGNIPWDASEEEVIQECSVFGRILSFDLVRHKDTGKHRGFGFMEFADEETALSSIRNQKGLFCRRRPLRVDLPTAIAPIHPKKRSHASAFASVECSGQIQDLGSSSVHCPQKRQNATAMATTATWSACDLDQEASSSPALSFNSSSSAVTPPYPTAGTGYNHGSSYCSVSQPESSSTPSSSTDSINLCRIHGDVEQGQVIINRSIMPSQFDLDLLKLLHLLQTQIQPCSPLLI